MELVDLFLIVLIAVIHGVGSSVLIGTRACMNWRGLTVTMIFGFILIMLEESLFRCVLPLYFPWIVCDLLFGIIHFSNLLLIPNKKLITFQVICVTFLGMLLPKFAFWTSTLLHLGYNAIAYLIASLGYSPPQSGPTFESTIVWIPKRRRSLGPSRNTRQERPLVMPIPKKLKSLYSHNLDLMCLESESY